MDRLRHFALLNFVLGNRAVFYSAPILWFGAAFPCDKHHPLYSAVRPVQRGRGRSADGDVADRQRCKRHAGTDHRMGKCTDRLPATPQLSKTGAGRDDQLLDSIATSRPSVVASLVGLWLCLTVPGMICQPCMMAAASWAQPLICLRRRCWHRIRQTIGILYSLTSQGHDGVRQHTSRASLFADFDQPVAGPVPDIYLVLTNQMAGWIRSISKLGNWDIETGQPEIPKNNNGKAYVDYIGLGCNYRGFPARVACGNISFDFERG